MKFTRYIASVMTFAFLALIGVGTAAAQNPNEEYREWQNAQRKGLLEWWAECFGARGEPVKRASTGFTTTRASA